MKKKNNSKLSIVLSVIALVLAIIAIVNSLGLSTITGYAISRTDIAYGSGYVGIGTNTNGPTKPLHVVGDVLFEDNLNVGTDLTVGDDLVVQDDLTVGGLAIFDNISAESIYINGTSIEDMSTGSLDLSGNIAIGGDLDVGGDIVVVGGIDLGDDAISERTCDSSFAGMIIFDAEVGIFYGCNGTDWKQFDNLLE